MFISRISRHPFGAYAALLLLEILSTHHCCSARQITNDCAPSSCGNFRNISSPFRLNTALGSCGDGAVQLACEDNVRLTLHLNMEKYYVEAISYSDSTIRLVDPAVQKDDCFSIPHHSLTKREILSFDFPDNDHYYYYYKYWVESSVLAFICCENEIPNPLPDYIMDTSSCKNGSGTAHNSSPSCVNMEGHSYVMVDEYVNREINDVPDLCRVNLMYTVPKNVRNMSYTDVHDILADGFELQWYNNSFFDTEPYPLRSKSYIWLLFLLNVPLEGIDWIAWRTGMAEDSYNLFHEGLTWIACRTGRTFLLLLPVHHPFSFTKLSHALSNCDPCLYRDISCAIVPMRATMSSDFTHL